MQLWHRFVSQLGAPGEFSCNGNLVPETTEERAAVLRSQVVALEIADGVPVEALAAYQASRFGVAVA